MGLIPSRTAIATDAPVVLNVGNNAQRVSSAPTGTLFFCASAGDYEVATNGTAFTGDRRFVNTSSGDVVLKTTATGFQTTITLSVGEIASVSYNGLTASLQGTETAINHAHVRWSGNSSIPSANASADGLLSFQNFNKLAGLNKAASGNAADAELVLGSDTRLTNSRTPTSHTHGQISNQGRIGSTAGLPVVTGANGELQAGAFGSSGTSTSPARADHQHDFVSTKSMSGWSRDGTTLTVTATDHGFSVGQIVDLIGTNPAVNNTDGVFTIASVPDANTFTAASALSPSLGNSGGLAIRRGFATGSDKIAIDASRRGVWGPSIIMFGRNAGFGQSGYAAGNPPVGMFPFNPSGNSVENFNADIYHPRLFNAGQFFGAGSLYRIVCAVRCTGIAFDGVHCQLRWHNGTTSQIISGLMDFGGGNDGIASKSYWATSELQLATDDWWTFVPYFGAFNGSNFANVQDVSVLAYRV